MDDQAKVRMLNALVSEDDYALWRELADENGISMSGLLVALGRRLTETGIDPAVIGAARRYDVDGRRRGGLRRQPRPED